MAVLAMVASFLYSINQKKENLFPASSLCSPFFTTAPVVAAKRNKRKKKDKKQTVCNFEILKNNKNIILCFIYFADNIRIIYLFYQNYCTA